MTISISYKNISSKSKLSNRVFFVDEKFKIKNIKKYLSKQEYLFIEDLIKGKDLSKKILVFDINSKKKIILISLKSDTSSSNVENLGAKFYGTIKNLNEKDFIIETDTIHIKLKNFVSNFFAWNSIKVIFF